MNLAEIRNAGGFIPAEPVKVEIEWKGYRVDVGVKRLSFADVESLYTFDGKSRTAKMISTAILLGEAHEPISYEDACRLDVELAARLIEALNSVNALDQKKLPDRR